MCDNPSCSVCTSKSVCGSFTISQSVGFNSSITSTREADSVSSSDVLIEMLTLPQLRPSKKKRKLGINSKAVCLIDTDVIQTLEAETKGKLLRAGTRHKKN